MFDFERWRQWLKDAAEQLRTDGFSVHYKINDKGLCGTSVDVMGQGVLASFRNFENGLVDYEIMDGQTGEFVVNETMIPVADKNFRAVFERFRTELGRAGRDPMCAG